MSTGSTASAQCGELNAASSGARQSPSLPFGLSKILHRHYERLAIVYVRQSDPQQVLHHRESKELQYNLADRAVALRPHQFGRDQPGRRFSSLKGRDVLDRFPSDGFQRTLGEICLMSRDDYVREGQHSGEDIILDDAIGQVLEEQVSLLLVDVHPQRTQLARLQRPDYRFAVDQRPAAGVD
jgi:hypothetical protein